MENGKPLKRVLSIRITDKDLQACVDLCEIYHYRIKSAGEAVVRTLELVAELNRMEGRIPRYSDAEALALLQDKFSQVTGRVTGGTNTVERLRNSNNNIINMGIGVMPIAQHQAVAEAISAYTSEDFAPFDASPINENFNSESYQQPIQTQNREQQKQNQFFLAQELEAELEIAFREAQEEEEKAFLENILLDDEEVDSLIIPEELIQLKKTSEQKPPWEGMSLINEETPSLKRDSIWKNASEASPVDDLLLLAIRAAYFNIPSSSWSSDSAELLVLKLHKQFKEFGDRRVNNEDRRK